MRSAELDGLVLSQRALNLTSADRWDLFRGHRERVTDLVLRSLPGPASRVCLLGAGNCNDIDLAALGAAGAAIDLVDIDEESLHEAVRRQPGTTIPSVHGGVDITGVWRELTGLRGPRAELAALIRLAARPQALALPGAYDVVVSPALLTQILAAAAQIVGEDHPQFDELALALRAGHIATLLGLTRPGGRAILITEIASRNEIATLEDVADDALAGLTLRAVMTQNVFRGVSPAAIVSWITQHRPFGGRLVHPGIIGPWRWRLRPALSYIVIGFVLTRP